MISFNEHKLLRKFKCLRGRLLDAMGCYRGLSWEGKDVYFILSTGRTGTTFFGQFLSSFEDVTAYHEPQPDFYDIGVAKARGQIESDHIQKIISANRKWILKEMNREENKIYVEANHYLFSLVPILDVIFNNPKFIHIVRDGRDVLRSAFNRVWYTENRRFDFIKATDFKDDPYADEWDQMSRFQKIAWYWQKKDRMICEQLQNNDCSKRIYFEDIFDQKQGYPGIKRILNFIGLSKTGWESFLSNKVRSTEDYKLPPWPEWNDKYRLQFKKIAGDHLEYHGYSWEDD